MSRQSPQFPTANGHAPTSAIAGGGAAAGAATAALPDADLLRLLPTAKLAVIYGRQSKSQEADVTAGRSLSSDTQMRRCQAHCEIQGMHPLMDLSLASVDLDTSGGAREVDRRRHGMRSWQKRPGLMRLYEAAKAGLYRTLVVYNMTRLGGDGVELHLIREAFSDAGVCIHVVEESIRTDTESGRMLYGIIVEFAHKRLADISQTRRDIAYTRALKGQHTGRPPAWIDLLRSYATTPEQLEIEVRARGPRGTRGWYKLSEEWAPVYRRIVRLRMAGLSYVAIARAMNDPAQSGGAPTTTPEGLAWAYHRIYEVLRDDNRLRMRGHAILGRGKSPDDPSRVVIRNVFPPLFEGYDGSVAVAHEIPNIPGVPGIPAGDGNTATTGDGGLMVDANQIMDALDAVQIAYRHERGLQPRTERTAAKIFSATSYMLSGILYCGICGARMHGGYTTSQGYSQYCCKNAAGGIVVHPVIRRNNRTDADGVRAGSEIAGRGMYIGMGKIEQAVVYGLAELYARLTQIDWRGEMERERRQVARELEQRIRAQKRRQATTGQGSTAHGTAAASAQRTMADVSRDIDKLLELLLAGRIRQSDYDRQYERYTDERDAMEAAASRRQAEDGTSAGFSALISAFAHGGEVGTVGGIGAAGTTVADAAAPNYAGRPALRTILLQIAERIDAPVYEEGVTRIVRSAHRGHETVREEPVMHVRIRLRQPLSDGTRAILSGMYKTSYQGPRRVVMETDPPPALPYPGDWRFAPRTATGEFTQGPHATEPAGES